MASHRDIRFLREEGVGFTLIFSISARSSAVLLPVMPFGRASNSGWCADAHSCVKALRLADEAADELGFQATLW